MRINVAARCVSKTDFDPGVEHGLFWDISTYMLYPLTWDPLLLVRLDGLPELRQPDDPVDAPGDAILMFAEPNADSDAPLLAEALGAGGRVILNHPSPQLVAAVGSSACEGGYGDDIISLRERWHFGSEGREPYIYPHMQTFRRLNPASGEVLSRIGGNPDLIVNDRAAIFAGDPFVAAYGYQYMPWKMTRMMGDLAELIVHAVSRLIEAPVSADEQRRMKRGIELRRDFHSFGYACLTVRELDRCYGGGRVDLAETCSLAVEAARRFVQGTTREATLALKAAFEALERQNRKLQPVTAIFTDTYHGGELYPDVGYFEIDWPEHPADVLRVSLDWARTRSYRFNVDLGATTVREMAIRFPDLFEQIRRQQARGHVEFVNGSCNQPYPPFHSLESQIRQFDTGREVWAEALGTTIKTYASQEYGFCPQMAAVLKQQGYRNAVVRVQNMGDAPTVTDEQIQWEAPCGDRLRSLPSHPHKSEDMNQFTYNNLHLKIALHQRDNLDFAVYTCLGDITFHRPMREELARVCHYAPVFGRFDTLQGYFRRTRSVAAPDTRFYMRDFDCDAGFINLDLWPVYKDYTGNYNSNCMNSMAATHLFAAAELLDAVGTARGEGAHRSDIHEKNWEALTHYQGHGTYIVPYFASGGFLGYGDSPASRSAGRSTLNVHEYLGPVDYRDVKQVTDVLMDDARKRANEMVVERVGADGASGRRIFSFAPARDRIVRIEGAAGRTFDHGGTALPRQDDGADALVEMPLPAYGFASIAESASAAPSTADPVRAGEDFLENGAIRAEFDTQSGTLRRLVRRSDGADLLAAGSHAFYAPQTGPHRCLGVTVKSSGPLRGSVEFELELTDQRGDVCRLRTCATLDAGYSVVTFGTEADRAPHVEGNQWVNHLGTRFELADASAEVWTSHFNVLESFPHRQVYSPYVLLVRGGNGDVAFLNEGNQFWVHDGGTLSHILIMENEPARRFRYAVGIPDENPIIQSRAWAGPYFAGAGDGTQDHQSLIDPGSDDVEVLSCRYDDGALLLRIANTADRRVRTTLGVAAPIASARITSLAGDPGQELKVVDGRAALSLRPWDLRQIRLTL